MSARSAAALLLPTAAACGHPDDATPRECRDVVVDFGNAMNEASVHPGACATDFDCTLQRPSLNCPAGARVETCPVSLSAEVYDGVIEKASSLENELCAMHCGIGVFVDCKTRPRHVRYGHEDVHHDFRLAVHGRAGAIWTTT